MLHVRKHHRRPREWRGTHNHKSRLLKSAGAPAKHNHDIGGYGSLRSQGRQRVRRSPRLPRRLRRLRGGDRRRADRRRASDARNRAGPKAPCRRRRRTRDSRDRRPASGRWPRSIPAATIAGSSAPRCRRRSDRAPSRLRRRAPARCCRATPDATPASCAGRGAPCAAAGRPRRGSWRGRKDPAGEPCRSRRFASHFRVPRRSGWPKVRPPRAFSVARRDPRTRSIPSSHSSLRIAPANRGSAGDAHSLKNPCGQNPLALAGRENRARTCTLYKMDSWDQNRRTRCRTRQPRSYNMAGLWRRVRADASTCSGISALQCVFSTTPQSYGLPFLHCRKARFVLETQPRGVLTATAAHIECLYVPPLRGGTFCFRKTGCCRVRANARVLRGRSKPQ